MKRIRHYANAALTPSNLGWFVGMPHDGPYAVMAGPAPAISSDSVAPLMAAMSADMTGRQ